MGAGAIHGHQETSQQSSPVSSSPLDSNPESSSHNHLDHTNTHSTQNTTSINRNKTDNTMKMSCEMCSSNFTLFKRKKICKECHRYFCSTCLPKPPSSSPVGRQCQKCLVLISGRFTRDDLQNWKIKDIRCFLDVRKVSTKGCREKHDLIELVLSHFGKEPLNLRELERQAEHDLFVQQMAARLTMESVSSPAANSNGEGVNEVSGVSNNTAGSSASRQSAGEGRSRRGDGEENPDPSRFNRMNSEEFRSFLQSQVEEFLNAEFAQRNAETSEERPASSSTAPIRLHLDKVDAIEDIDQLSVRQLKELLVTNFVDFKGCCEKPELIQRVKRLWSDHQENKIKAERIHKADEEAVVAGTPSDSNLQTPEDPSVDIPVESSTSSTKATGTGSSSPQKPSEDGLHHHHHHGPPPPPSPPPPPDVLEAPETSEGARCSPASVSPSKHAVSSPDAGEPADSLCRVCMDSLTNCILLECGHMVTCTTCGKQLAECPICRQYISRVVRVFRS